MIPVSSQEQRQRLTFEERRIPAEKPASEDFAILSSEKRPADVITSVEPVESEMPTLGSLPKREQYLVRLLKIRLERGELEEVKEILPKISDKELKIDLLFSFYDKITPTVRHAADRPAGVYPTRAPSPPQGYSPNPYYSNNTTGNMPVPVIPVDKKITTTELLDLITSEILDMPNPEEMAGYNSPSPIILDVLVPGMMYPLPLAEQQILTEPDSPLSGSSVMPSEITPSESE